MPRPSSPRRGHRASRSCSAILWTIPTFGLFVTSFRPPADIQTSGWWTFFANPGITFENYTNAWSNSAGGLGGFFLNSFVIVVPGGADPDQPGAAGGVLLRLDRFQGPRFPVRRGLRAADRADPGHADPAADHLRQLRAAELVLAGVDLAHDLRPAAGDLPAAQLHEGGPGVDRRGRPGGRRRPREDLLRRAACRCWSRPSRPSASSSSCGCGTTCWWRSSSRRARTCSRSPLPSRNCPARKGSQWELLSAGAFISIVVPLAVFLGLQRYFVRGLLAGGVKG